MTLGIAVSVGSLYFAARDVEWAQVGTQLAGARVGWLVGVMVASFAALYIRAQRWRVLLRPLGDVPLYPALSATAIGAGASAVFPFRLGEIVRPALLGRRCGVSVSAAFSSVLLERLFDVLLVIGCFIAASLIYPEVPANVREGAYALGGIAVVAFVVLLIVHRQRERAERVLARR
ncbi:MAG TPA: lysylphosphatidylglycerol synthase transmembrane domain-containing protein, partial [Candidatus Binatia bacterium]|nr:lysylphosphatidylglycerol synthase transmembrane domain-containing protein [Candidatus Binatia bacterium]